MNCFSLPHFALLRPALLFAALSFFALLCAAWFRSVSLCPDFLSSRCSAFFFSLHCSALLCSSFSLRRAALRCCAFHFFACALTGGAVPRGPIRSEVHSAPRAAAEERRAGRRRHPRRAENGPRVRAEGEHFTVLFFFSSFFTFIVSSGPYTLMSVERCRLPATCNAYEIAWHGWD